MTISISDYPLAIPLLVGAILTGCASLDFDARAEPEPDAGSVPEPPPACPTEPAGIRLDTSSLTDVVEGGEAATYTVVLDAEPCSDVEVMISAPADLTVSPAALSFSPDDWDQAVTVSVVADLDDAFEGDHQRQLDHAVKSEDPRYDMLAVNSPGVSVLDRARVSLVTVPLQGAPGANGDSRAGGISDDGRYVVFALTASNLVVGDINGASDVFRRDLEAAATIRVSTGQNGESNGPSTGIAASADGDRIAYYSEATNLVGDSVTGAGDVYLYTASTGAKTLVSRQCDGCNNELSSTVAISGDGRRIAYTTRRRLAGDTENEYDVFVYDAQESATAQESLSSTDSNGAAFWGSNAFGPSLSATGRFVGFSSAARALDTNPADIAVQNFHPYVKDSESRALERVSRHSSSDLTCEGVHRATSSGRPLISATGTLAAFDSQCAFTLEPAVAADDNDSRDVFLRDRSNGVTHRVSVASDGSPANGDSFIAGLSDDGRYVLFLSDADNLVPGDTNGERDLFLRDRTAGTTTRVGVDRQVAQLSAGVTAAVLSRSGRFAAFATAANIDDADRNEHIDVYRIQLRP